MKLWDTQFDELESGKKQNKSNFEAINKYYQVLYNAMKTKLPQKYKEEVKIQKYYIYFTHFYTIFPFLLFFVWASCCIMQYFIVLSIYVEAKNAV